MPLRYHKFDSDVYNTEDIISLRFEPHKIIWLYTKFVIKRRSLRIFMFFIMFLHEDFIESDFGYIRDSDFM